MGKRQKSELIRLQAACPAGLPREEQRLQGVRDDADRAPQLRLGGQRSKSKRDGQA